MLSSAVLLMFSRVSPVPSLVYVSAFEVSPKKASLVLLHFKKGYCGCSIVSRLFSHGYRNGEGIEKN